MTTKGSWALASISVRAVSAALLLAFVTAPTAAQRKDRLEVVVSLPPQVWLVERLGGDRWTVWSLLEPGDSPETYQPTDAEVTHAARADLFVPIGIPFERGAWARALRQADGLSVVEPPSPPHDEHDHQTDLHHHDPHIWLSPRRLLPQARAVSEALRRLDPQNAAAYARRLERTEHELDDLHLRLASTLSGWRGHRFLVHHPSWGTFAEDFGLRQLAIEGQGHEPSDADMTAVLAEAREADLGVVFVQPGHAGASRHAVARALQARVEILDPLPRDLEKGLLEAADRLVASLRERADGSRR